MTMFKMEMNGYKLEVIFNNGFYEAIKNGKVFFRHENYEVVRSIVID